MRQQSSPLTVSNVNVAGTNDLSTSFTTDAINLISGYAYSIQVAWSTGSSPIGTFKLQASDDSGDNGSGQGVTQPTNFTDVAGSSLTVTGGPGNLMYDSPLVSYRWIRLVYTTTSGSAPIIAANINTKGS